MERKFSMMSSMSMSSGARMRAQRKERRTQRGDSLCAALFLILLVTQVESSSARAEPHFWRTGYSGDGTTHEQTGQLHFPEVQFSKYVPVTNYTERQKVSNMWVDIVFQLSRTFFDKMFPLDPTIPRGYIKFMGTENMKLGPKVDKNDWAEWLNAYWLMWAWVLLQVTLIITIPFIGVIYFCLCCFRCKMGCPACESGLNARRRALWGTCLCLIIPLIGLCMILSFLSNGMLERGLQTSKEILEVGTVDTCNFLKDVSDHIHHLFVNNYQEMETHLVTMLLNAPNHLFTDLNDVAEGNSLAELVRILTNLFKAVMDTGPIESLQDHLLRDTLVLRDALRGVKRNINYAAAVLCGHKECLKFLPNFDINFMDTSRCLHLDEVPSMRDIRWQIMVEYLPEEWRAHYFMGRLRKVSDLIRDEMARVTPMMIRDLRRGALLFADESRKLEEIIDVVISDIHLGTLRATKTFEDLYDKFNETRYFLVLYIAVIVIVILAVLVIALLFGCFGKRVTGTNEDLCSMKLGSYALILAMILIFCVISAMLAVGLFYFIIGSVAYKGACAPLRQQKSSALFRQLDAHIDLRKFSSYQSDESNRAAAPLRVSSLIQVCEGKNFLFRFLREQNIYNVDNLLRVRVMTPQERNFDESLDLSKTYLLLGRDRDNYLTLSETSIVGLYHSRLFTESLCPEFAPIDLENLGQNLLRLSQSLSWHNYHAAKVAFENEYVSLKYLMSAFYAGIHRDVTIFVKTLQEIDKLILYENYNFADSIRILRQSVLDTEKFIQTKGTAYISTLGQNLTAMIESQINAYITMIVNEANYEVGRCEPLSYIYERGLDLVCNRMVDPINGYWIGVVIAAFLLMPVLCVAHRLQCLYKQVKLLPIVPVRGAHPDQPSCPLCSGDGKPSRVEGGQPSYWCPKGRPDAEQASFIDGERTITATTAIISDLESNKDRKNKLD